MDDLVMSRIREADSPPQPSRADRTVPDAIAQDAQVARIVDADAPTAEQSTLSERLKSAGHMPTTSTANTNSGAARHHPQPIPISSARIPNQSGLIGSPSLLRSSSPRLHSPASSEIFERNVQEPVSISSLGGEEKAAHIPSHVVTEDHIPPALEASAQAITSDSLNPDEVEIVTSAAHQPAASVLEGTGGPDIVSPVASLQHQKSEESEHLASVQQSGTLSGPAPSASMTEADDTASNYGQLDPNDVRRLSFISFKDIVQSEHQQLAALGEAGSRDSLHMGSHGVASSFVPGLERAASPLRSPRSPPSAGVTTPPPNVSVDHAAEQSPVRSLGVGSPGSGQHGELTIETMRQALRKTASGDLGTGSASIRSAGMSPVACDEASMREIAGSRSRTNT